MTAGRWQPGSQGMQLYARLRPPALAITQEGMCLSLLQEGAYCQPQECSHGMQSSPQRSYSESSAEPARHLLLQPPTHTDMGICCMVQFALGGLVIASGSRSNQPCVCMFPAGLS